jgi:hypothetical protein
MRQIQDMQARVRAACGTVDILGAGWDAFTLLLDTCEAGVGLSSGLFAAFAFAAAAASRGRLMLESAPSLPPGAGNQASRAAFVKHDLDQAAGALAGLAAALGQRLGEAAVAAVDVGDRAASLDAAAEAVRVAELLSGGWQ